jgi:serine protease Do
MLFGSLLVAVVAAAVAGVAAQRADRADAQPQVERRAGGDRRDGDTVFLPPGARRAISLDGRGSRIGVVVSDAEGAAAGVRVDGVDHGSPADRAGLREGDLLVEFDGERVRSARQLTRLVQETPDGRTVPLTYSRDGARQTVEITPEPSAATWGMHLDEPEIRAQVERGLRGLRELPRPDAPLFDFRFDGMPAAGARGRLGVQVETLSDQLAEYFGAKGGGVLVSRVTADSPAQKAGLKAGDVITAVNGTAVRDAGELVDELREARDGAEVALDVVRDRKSTTLKATLERPAPPRMRRPA